MRREQPLVSVIVPVYMVERWLGRCVDSIVSQTYTNLEIILVDDGSPDSCPQLCDSYASQDPRIKVIHQSNQGLSAARNAALDACTGEYITFVDSDDWVAPSLVEELVRVALTAPGSIVVGDFVRVEERAVQVEHGERTFEPVRVLSVDEALVQLHFGLGIRLVTAWGKLYPARIFETVRYPVGRAHEDEFVAHELIVQAAQVVLVQQALYFYFVRPGSIMGTRRVSELIDAADALVGRAEFLREAGFVEIAALAEQRLAYRYIALIRLAVLTDDQVRLRQFRQRARILARQMVKSGARGVALELWAYSYAHKQMDGARRLVGRPLPLPQVLSA